VYFSKRWHFYNKAIKIQTALQLLPTLAGILMPLSPRQK
jgi:hypothetical protein